MSLSPRIVMIATGSWGDVRPNLVLGHALQETGYEVLLVASEPFREYAARRGVPFAGLSVDIQAMLDAQIHSRNPLQTMRWMRKVSEATVLMGREIADVIQQGDTVLLNEGILPLVNGAFEKCKVRHVHVNLQPWAPTGEFVGMAPKRPSWLPVREASYNRWAGSLVRRGQWWSMGKMGNQVRTKYLALPKQTWAKHRAMLSATPSVLLVSRHVLPAPSDWQAHQRITGYIFDDEGQWQAPQDLLDFLAGGDRPVYIGFGSMRERKPEEATQLLIHAVRQAGKRAILLSGWAGIGAESLPKDVFLLEYAPHDWLFPRMAAVVHHGGAGTTAAALRAGVPSIIVPFMSDQPFWGRRIHELGAGAKPIPRSSLTADNLAAAITEATTNRAMQEKSQELSVKIEAEDGISEAVSSISEFLGSAQTR